MRCIGRPVKLLASQGKDYIIGWKVRALRGGLILFWWSIVSTAPEKFFAPAHADNLL